MPGPPVLFSRQARIIFRCPPPPLTLPATENFAGESFRARYIYIDISISPINYSRAAAGGGKEGEVVGKYPRIAGEKSASSRCCAFFRANFSRDAERTRILDRIMHPR